MDLAEISRTGRRENIPSSKSKMDSEKKIRTRYPPDEDKIPHPLRTTIHTNLLKSLSRGLQPSGNRSPVIGSCLNKQNKQRWNKRVQKSFITKVEPSMRRLVASQLCRYQATLFIYLVDPGTGSHLIQATWTTRRTIIHTTSRQRPGTKAHTHH